MQIIKRAILSFITLVAFSTLPAQAKFGSATARAAAPAGTASSAGAKAPMNAPPMNSGSMSSGGGMNSEGGGSGERMQGACKKIVEACKAAGFVQGEWKTGNGLWKDCVDPIVQGTGPVAGATHALPTVDASAISECKSKHPKFGEGKRHSEPTK